MRPSSFVSMRLRRKLSFERRIRAWLGQRGGTSAGGEDDEDIRQGQRATAGTSAKIDLAAQPTQQLPRAPVERVCEP